MVEKSTAQAIEQAAAVIADADALLVCAGAGMSIDSGLPGFRGAGGLWTMSTKDGEKSVPVVDVAQPKWFYYRPEMVWGFYGWRLNMYRQAVPHSGYRQLLEWGRAKSHGVFVFTSNVDGLFQRAGFGEQEVVECHGSIHYLQCTKPCHHDLWDAASVDLVIDESTRNAREPLPRCSKCRRRARPNILMFEDMAFIRKRVKEQRQRFDLWLRQVAGKNLVVIEIGAGVSIPRVRELTTDIFNHLDCHLIRINPTDIVDKMETPNSWNTGNIGAATAQDRYLPIALGAREALDRIQAEISLRNSLK